MSQAKVFTRIPAEREPTRRVEEPQVATPSSTNGQKTADYNRYLCQHYNRGCDLVAPCCNGKTYHCRICHDENNDHELNRKEVNRVRCRYCGLHQELAVKCQKCKADFGTYACLECCLFDDDVSKKQFHCAKCGICRVGGEENFFHCDTCGYCLNKQLEGSHKCIPNASKSGCPVCLEDLHSSREGIHVSKCGHLIHSSCLQSMAEKGLYRCPQCNMSLGNMQRHWNHMDQEVKAWRMPRRYRNFKVKVLCNDCHKEELVNFHIIGMKCKACGSYNTRRTGSEEPPDETDSELSSDSEMDDDESNVTPFERHISQLLRSLSARVRALEREGEGGSDFDTDHDSDNDIPDLLDDDVTYDDDDEDDDEEDENDLPLLVDEITGHTLVNQYTAADFNDDDHSSAHDSSDSWQTEEEEYMALEDADFTVGTSNVALEDTSPDSGFSDDLSYALDFGSSEPSQNCSIM